MSESVQPGSYNISKLMLHSNDGSPSYDLMPQMSFFSFTEDMEIPNMKGIVAFIDNTNAFGRTDFDGLETVNAVFKSLGEDHPEIDITFRVFRTDLKNKIKKAIHSSKIKPNSPSTAHSSSVLKSANRLKTSLTTSRVTTSYCFPTEFENDAELI